MAFHEILNKWKLQYLSPGLYSQKQSVDLDKLERTENSANADLFLGFGCGDLQS